MKPEMEQSQKLPLVSPKGSYGVLPARVFIRHIAAIANGNGVLGRAKPVRTLGFGCQLN